ncbi:HTH_Tnp_Tc3_2 domain-containing protein [Trichonephila clavipes]|nr:HTH_Tnp_Tc3_2 domain-containing protein [Trichonephila clavipes]
MRNYWVLEREMFFGKKEINVYPDDEKKPPVAEGLNRKAKVILENIWPTDKTNHSLIKTPNNAHSVAFSQHANSPCLIEDKTFNDCGTINNLIDYVDGQEELDSLRADKMSKKTNCVEYKQRSGLPKMFNEREERWIVRQVCVNSRTSAVKMTLQNKSRFGKSVNPEAVRNVLRKHNYHGRVPQGKPYISKQKDKLGWRLLKCM